MGVGGGWGGGGGGGGGLGVGDRPQQAESLSPWYGVFEGGKF